MSSAKKVCNEEARYHDVNESDIKWRERGRGGPYGRRTKATTKPLQKMLSRHRG